MLLLLGCNKEPKKLMAPAECRTPEVVACLQPYAFNRLSNDDIRRIATEGVPRCLSKDKDILGRQQAKCLPIEMGKDNRGREIAVRFFCSDVCPDQGYAYVGFAESIKKAECCKAGEIAARDFAWGGYAGCRPRVAVEAERAQSGAKGPINSLCGANR